jgi:hypothetical protein
MKAFRRWIGILLAAALASTAMASDLEFRAPNAPGDAAAAALRDLAGRLVPVYQDPDPDRYLANLSALQMVAGNFPAADESRRTLRERRRRPGIKPVTRDVIFDIYAHARTLELQQRLTFADAFARSYREVADRIGDRDAYILNAWLRTPPSFYQDGFQ